MRILAFIGLFLCLEIHAYRARVVYLEDEDMEVVHLQGGKATVLSFPTKPEKVICGNKSAFSIEFIENDVVITPLSSISQSNLFIYLLGRRFGFDLVTGTGPIDEILVVRDKPAALSNEKPNDRRHSTKDQKKSGR